MQKNIIEFYIVYLLKFIASKEAFGMAKEALEKASDIFGISTTLKNNSKVLETTSVTQLSTQTTTNSLSVY